MIFKLAAKTQQEVVAVIESLERRYKSNFSSRFKSFTMDNNETTNKLIRRFVPKGTNIDNLNGSDVKRIERWMNNYPRRMFGYRPANEIRAA